VGYYIEVPARFGKAQQIADGFALVHDRGEWRTAPGYKAEIISQPASLAEVPDDKALICVIANAMFESAGYCFSQAELEAFTQPGDDRARTWVLMDKDAAEACSRYPRAAVR